MESSEATVMQAPPEIAALPEAEAASVETIATAVVADPIVEPEIAAERPADIEAIPAPADAKPAGPRSLGIDPAVIERKRKAQESWERAVAAHAGGDVVEGLVTAAVKGGLLVDVDGVRGFLPASQASPGAGVAIETLVKQKLPLKIIDVDAARKRVVVSHRRAAESQKRAARTTLLRSLAIGQKYTVTVARLADFGAIEKLIKEHHSYENPEIIALPIVAGSQAYLDWIRDETEREIE